MNLNAITLATMVCISGCASHQTANKTIKAPVAEVKPVTSYHVTQELGDPRYVFCNTDDCNNHTPKTLEQAVIVTPITSTLLPNEKTINQHLFKVHFDFAKSELNKTNKAEIANIKKYLAETKQHQLKIVGKTDPIGTNKYNKRLAMLRAAQVKKSLSGDGVNIQVSTDCCITQGDYVEARSADVTVLVE